MYLPDVALPAEIATGAPKSTPATLNWIVPVALLFTVAVKVVVSPVYPADEVRPSAVGVPTVTVVMDTAGNTCRHWPSARPSANAEPVLLYSMSADQYAVAELRPEVAPE
ncbi:unannotated protein [freshwater metagenome]|uniref:Unannotated protein n=1 Tax=freshwater metagenome TaxID=449393 RepID=A0A6J7LA18_9ZZZZ